MGLFLALTVGIVTSLIVRAAPSPSDPLLEWLKNNASAVGLLAFIVVALMRGWFVTARELRHVDEECGRLRTERDKALDLVYRQAEISTRALDVSERLSGQ